MHWIFCWTQRKSNKIVKETNKPPLRTMEWEEAIELYKSWLCCGICLKTEKEAVLLPNDCQEFFSAMQMYPVPFLLCSWCRRKLQTFSKMQTKAETAHRILSLIRSLANNPFIHCDVRIPREIEKLKAEPYRIENLSTLNCKHIIYDEDERDQTTATAKTTKKRGRPRTLIGKNKIENIEIDELHSKEETVPLKKLKEDCHDSVQTDDISEIEQFHHENLQFQKSAKVQNKVMKRRPKFESTGQSATQIIEFIESNQKSEEMLKHQENIQTSVVNLQKPDIILRLEEMENENFIISEEIEKHVKTIDTAEDNETHRLARLAKPAYVKSAFKCEQCILGYASKEEFDEHMTHHSPTAGPHSCRPCGLHFSRHRLLAQHTATHARHLRCSLCTHASANTSAAAKHHVSRHSRVTFTCWLCDQQFRRVVNLKKHLQKVHPAESDAFGCPVCAQEFADQVQLYQHARVHPASDVIVRECPTCGKKSANAYHMWQHQKTHEKQTLPIVCELCGNTFKTRQLLLSHAQRLHTDNSKKFQCDCCGKFFYDKSELSIHVHWTHRREGGVQCGICQKKYRTAYLLNDHVQRVHKNIPRPKDKLCDLCGRGFASRKSLKSHRYIHTGERPFACPDCGQTFRQKCALRIHCKAKHLRYIAPALSNT